MPRILVAEPIAKPGRDLLVAAHDTSIQLNLSRDDLLTVLAGEGGWDALVVRSQTRVDADLLAAAAPRLSVVGVASVGTDRIDLAAATRAGVMVVNAPTGNTIAAAEHTMALMLALLRRIPGADASVRRGEWERGRWVGAELRHRTLGVIGLGKIGKAVARRAAAFEMRVIAHDPFLTADQASEHAAKLVGLPELLARADVITIHVPLVAETKGMIGRAQIEAMKPGAVVLNVARGGLVDEAALARALTAGTLGGAAIDVFSTEPMAADNPLREAPNTILTPHLGASTAEAQDRVGVEMAEQLLLALSGITPPYAVNAPSIAMEVAPQLRPYVEVGRRLALLGRQLVSGPVGRVSIGYAGEIAAWDGAPIRAAVLAGMLAGTTDQRVNAVNADLVARERDLTVDETRADAAEPWTSLVRVSLGEGDARVSLAGSSAHGRPRLTGVGDVAIDAELAGTILVTRHRDQPGIVGAVGSALAEAGVNISSLELSRLSAAGEAMMFVSVDEPIPEKVLAALRVVPGMLEASVVELPPLP